MSLCVQKLPSPKKAKKLGVQLTLKPDSISLPKIFEALNPISCLRVRLSYSSQNAVGALVFWVFFNDGSTGQFIYNTLAVKALTKDVRNQV